MIKRSALLIAPSLALCFIFSIFPMLLSAIAGLWKIDFQDNVFIGFQNYIRALTDSRFLGSLVNGLLYAILIPCGSYAIGIPLGLIVADQPTQFRKRIQTALYLPTLAGGVIIAALWMYIFHPFEGPLAGIINVWSNRFSAVAAVSMIIMIAGCSGTAMIISVIAASIGNDVREAAKIDGAHAGQIRWRIILPGIIKPITAMFLLAMIAGTQIWETIQTISYARPQGTSGSPIWEIYDTGFIKIQYGMACAKTAIYLAMFGVIMLIVKKVKK